jgi:thiol:disulfide interchange protein
MKALSTKHMLSFLLTASLILGSCSSYRQVACPEIDQNNYLARTTSKIKTRAPQRTRQTYAKNLDKLSANKFDAKKPRSSKDAVNLIAEDQAPELSPVSMIGAQIETSYGPDQDLLASADNRSVQSGVSATAGEQLKISDASRAFANSGSLELMSPKEMRKFNRRIERELRSSMQVAPRAAGPASNAKPAKPMAIAALVLGITSLLILPIFTGILGIVFGAIALKRIKANPNQEGRGMALAGLICGLIGAAFGVIMLAIGIGALGVL